MFAVEREDVQSDGVGGSGAHLHRLHNSEGISLLEDLANLWQLDVHNITKLSL